MATPFFKVQGIVERHSVHALSSNYELYGDMSHRMMDVLRDSSFGWYRANENAGKGGRPLREGLA